MKIFVTKYIFTDGILEYDAEIEDGFAVVRNNKTYPMFFHKNDWHETMEKAIEDAEKKRSRKLASLYKQINKISSMTFGK